MSKGEERRRGGREVKEGWGVGERERERESAEGDKGGRGGEAG